MDKTTSSVTKIVAFAGTGKTTTLVHLAKSRPDLKFLVVVYNKSVAQEAQKLFPKETVKCMTAHSMAFKKRGFMYANKGKLTNNLKARDIINSKVLSSSSSSSLQQRSAKALKTIENFMNSPDPEITDENVPALWPNATTREDEPLTARERNDAYEDARAVWEVMVNVDDPRVKMPHDGYLKAWQLSKPSLQWVWQHDVLLIDEGQDMSPAMLDIFLGQEGTPKVIVGDPNQQIYMFRGAINALERVEADNTFYLTQSFRFGPEIAFAGGHFLFSFQKVPGFISLFLRKLLLGQP